MNVEVRQRQYAIGVRGTSSSVLVTENIWTCTGFAGVDDNSGVVFLCHLNTPWCPFAIKDVVTDLRKHVSDLSGFQLYMVNGINPGVSLFLCLIAGIMMIAGYWLWGVVSLTVAIGINLTKLHLRYQLWRLKAFARSPIPLGSSTEGAFRGKCGVRVDSEIGKTPEKYSYKHVRDHKRFKEPKWWSFKMTRAVGSAR
jgi:hypothetical protein